MKVKSVQRGRELRGIGRLEFLHFASDGMILLISGDLRLMLQSEADIVQSVEQAVAGEFVDCKSHGETLPIFDTHRLQVDCELVAFDLLRTAHDLSDLFVGEAHGQEAVLQAVVCEDVGE